MSPEEQLVLQECTHGVDRAFTVMNWFASGEHLKLWQRTDHESVLGEVYMALAPVSIALHKLELPDASSARQFVREQMDREVQERVDELKGREAALAEGWDKLKNVEAKMRAEMEAELARRLEEEKARFIQMREGSWQSGLRRRLRL